MNLNDKLHIKNNIEQDCDYYALSLTATDKNEITWSAITHWIGFKDNDPRFEIREPSFVEPNNLIKLWNELKYPFIIVNTERDFNIYLLIGGNSLMNSKVAKSKIPDILKPEVVVRSGPMGFNNIKSYPPSAFQKAPTPKLRMKVLERDNYKCIICGRSPVNYSDIELHVHHIRPWSKWGVTSEDNLLTLCHTCHKGLDPHYTYDLFKFLMPKFKIIDADHKLEELFQGIKRYRNLILEKVSFKKHA